MAESWDINPVNIAAALAERVKDVFPSFQQSNNLNEREELLVDDMLKQFHKILTDAVFHEEDELVDNPSQVSSFSQDMDLVDDCGNAVNRAYDGISIERKAEILELIRVNSHWKIHCIQRHGGKEFRYWSYRKLWEDQIRAGGTRYEKLQVIDEFTYKKFLEAREKFQCVRDTTLQTWGLQAYQSFVNPNFRFCAGTTWTLAFKQRHGISSRKVTKLVSRRSIVNQENLLEAARKFQEEVKALTPNYSPELVLNTDQTGFEYEITGNRTLSFKGEKTTFAVAKSPKNLATHSYTVQYVVSLAGKILPSVFVCLQEVNGRLGPRVQDGLFVAPNVTLTCSTSGKLTTSIYEFFLKNCIAPHMRSNFLLILDSWSGQTNPSSYASVFGGSGQPSCSRKVIPSNCTEICQPLDTTFHQQLKYFAKEIYREFNLRYSDDVNPQDEITVRNNIIRTQSLLHNQLSAPIFEDMVRYCWYSSGLSDDHPTFLSVKQACFSFGSRDSVRCSQNCSNLRFMKCSHCLQIFCFDCFYYKYHFHF